MGLVSDDGALELYDRQVRITNRDGEIVEEFDPSHYLDYIGEHIEDWFYLKLPYSKGGKGDVRTPNSFLLLQIHKFDLRSV